MARIVDVLGFGVHEVTQQALAPHRPPAQNMRPVAAVLGQHEFLARVGLHCGEELAAFVHVGGEGDLLQDVAASLERGHCVLAVQRDGRGDEDDVQPVRQHLVVCAAEVGLGEERAEPFEGGRVNVATGHDIAIRHKVEDARRTQTAVQPDTPTR